MGAKTACMFILPSRHATSASLPMAPSVPLLFAGRILGGVSTKLLFSVFESWMVTDFHARGLRYQGRRPEEASIWPV